MKEKLLQALKTKFSNLGFTDKAFSGVADYLATTVTEDNLDASIAGVEGLLRAFQGDIDTRVTTALKNAQKEPKTTKEDEKTKTPEQPNEILQAIKFLTDKVTSLEAEKQADSLFSKWSKAVADAGVSNEKLISRWKPSSMDDFDTNLADLVEFNKSLVVEGANNNYSGKPNAGKGGADESEKGKSVLEAWDKSRDVQS